jgi:hypothetical protein
MMPLTAIAMPNTRHHVALCGEAFEAAYHRRHITQSIPLLDIHVGYYNGSICHDTILITQQISHHGLLLLRRREDDTRRQPRTHSRRALSSLRMRLVSSFIYSRRICFISWILILSTHQFITADFTPHYIG